MRRRNKVICFFGIDGSGKSTHARHLFRELRAAGVKCQYKWLRYPRFYSYFALGLLAVFRLRRTPGPSLRSNEKRLGNGLAASRKIRELWLLIVLIDTFLSALRNVYLPTLLGRVMVLDRFALDPLIDTVVDSFPSMSEDLTFGTIGKAFVKLIPRKSIVLVFDIEEDIAAFRINYTGDTSGLARSRALYRTLSKMYRWNLIHTDRPFFEIHDEIMHLVMSRETLS